MQQPSVSVVITSDYASGADAGWEHLQRTLAALRVQDFAEPFEVIYAESRQLAAQMPPAIQSAMPELRVVTADTFSSNALKGVGATAARAELVALLDADCIPERQWLRRCVEVMQSHPETAVASGRTLYGERFLDRAMALAARSFLEMGRSGPTRHITTNNCICRRAILEQFPITATPGAHMSLGHNEEILRSGAPLRFEAQMVVHHAYDGWAWEREMRRSLGYGVIRARRMDGRIRYARLARLGLASVPLFVAARVARTAWFCIRHAHRFGVRTVELPATLALATAACMLEIPGMLHAVRDLPPPPTQYR